VCASSSRFVYAVACSAVQVKDGWICRPDMNLARMLLSRCASLFHRRRPDEDLDEELGSYIDFAVEENLNRGMSKGVKGPPDCRELSVSPEPKRKATRGWDTVTPAIKLLFRKARLFKAYCPQISTSFSSWDLAPRHLGCPISRAFCEMREKTCRLDGFIC
jgi:hypothetical protein